MAATKRARVDRGMVTEMRVVGDEEGKGDDEKDGVGDEGLPPCWHRSTHGFYTTIIVFSMF